MHNITNEINSFNLDQNKEKLTQIYDKCYLLKETLNLQIKDREEKYKTFEIIQKIINNILKDKNNEKFRTLKYSNKILNEYVFCRKCVIEFLLFLGFVELDIDKEKCLVIMDLDQNLLEITLSTILLSFQDDSSQSNQNKVETEKPTQNLNTIPHEEKNQKFLEDLRMSRDEYIHQHPLIQGPSNTNFGKLDVTKILKDTAKVRKQNLNENFIENQISYKSNIKNIDPENRIVTLNDLKREEYTQPSSNESWKVTKSSIISAKNDRIGLACLELTNLFRKRNNLPPLKWDDEVWSICYGHSKNMGEKKVPFSHEGFNNRINSLKFKFFAAYENVFFSSGYQNDIAELAVNGWINSPGHRKNMLSNSNHCAIASYQNSSGEIFLTQIFIKK